ncbi:uncharacterized protein [Rutidosis leptorrhynchoides]|uniref:uncharacterized protein isoform X2 n=1 Tax=Rutidosis leptorrhynchoides TaxID=125765 RepID=UPI003A995FA3
MTGGARSRRNDKPSINYRYNPHGGDTFDLVNVTREDLAPGSHNNGRNFSKQAETNSSHVLSTADLISGVSQLWNIATSSLPVLRHRTSTQNNESLQKENRFCYPAKEGNIIASISSEGQNVSVNLKDDSHVLPTVSVQKNLDLLHVSKKICAFDCCNVNNSDHHLFKCLDTAAGKKVSSVTISYGLQSIYEWMRSSEHDKGRSNPVNNMSKLDDVMTTESDVYHIYAVADDGGIIVPTFNLQQHSRDEIDDDLHEIKEDQETKSVTDLQIVSSLSVTQHNALAKQEHAFAGAFAGVFVSLCLHPMDTVKTIIQSCPTDQRSIQYIGKSIISERGLSGLYRGISSNIASSAPISAIYTFSYESVKGVLLPLFAKEYHSVVHCVAGGCASVATSFVFTPSERIKQQMQVGSHYHNCWNALLGIVGKGGFVSLYNGWGAVLCRNVPHSIIKFYTYESLKKVMISSQQAQPTTTSTLLCGGLAGSTAALFTTPFDVVKTRLQTQIPGSINRYHGVFDTLKNIAQHEGLKGLYRGLTPRLAMYMTQGALFFASYESFKTLFSLEATKLESSSLSS